MPQKPNIHQHPHTQGRILKLYLYGVMLSGVLGGAFSVFQPFYHAPAGADLWMLAFIATSLLVNGSMILAADSVLDGQVSARGWLLYWMLAAVVIYAITGPDAVLVIGILRLLMTWGMLHYDAHTYRTG